MVNPTPPGRNTHLEWHYSSSGTTLSRNSTALKPQALMVITNSRTTLSLKDLDWLVQKILKSIMKIKKNNNHILLAPCLPGPLVWTGFKKEMFLVSRIKVNVAHAGLSPQLARLNQLTTSLWKKDQMCLSLPSLSNNLLTALRLAMDAVVAGPVTLSTIMNHTVHTTSRTTHTPLLMAPVLLKPLKQVMWE